MTQPDYVELRTLELGVRFRFLAFPEQTATLIEKGKGRALIQYDRKGEMARAFDARDPKTGGTRHVEITLASHVTEPCALGAQVVPYMEIKP